MLSPVLCEEVEGMVTLPGAQIEQVYEACETRVCMIASRVVTIVDGVRKEG